MVVAAMRFLSSPNAIIIDVRENGGGSGDYLSSYFLPYPTQLSSWYSGEDGFLTEFWTLKDIGTCLRLSQNLGPAQGNQFPPSES